jgi:hypothetical protein
MKKTLLACAAIAALAAGTLTIPTQADARCRVGCAVGIGAAAIVGGAIIGNAIAGGPPPGYAYGPYAPASGYVAYSDYYGPQPVGCPGGYWGRRPLYDRWDNQIGWSRPRFFCPY